MKCPCPKEIWNSAQSLVARGDVLRTQVWTSQRQSLSSRGAQEAERGTQGRWKGMDKRKISLTAMVGGPDEDRSQTDTEKTDRQNIP